MTDTDPDAPTDEVAYDLADWSEDQRAELGEALDAERVAWRFEEDELVVAEADAEVVETLIDEIEDPDALDADDGEDGGAEVLSSLYVSSDVLLSDPTASAAVAEFLTAAEAAADLPAPFGVEDDVWAEIGARADVLADALGAEADDDEVVVAARALRDLLHPLV